MGRFLASALGGAALLCVARHSAAANAGAAMVKLIAIDAKEHELAIRCEIPGHEEHDTDHRIFIRRIDGPSGKVLGTYALMQEKQHNVRSAAVLERRKARWLDVAAMLRKAGFKLAESPDDASLPAALAFAPPEKLAAVAPSLETYRVLLRERDDELSVYVSLLPPMRVGAAPGAIQQSWAVTFFLRVKDEEDVAEDSATVALIAAQEERSDAIDEDEEREPRRFETGWSPQHRFLALRQLSPTPGEAGERLYLFYPEYPATESQLVELSCF